MTYVQITVRFRWKTGVNLRIPLFRNVLDDDIPYKIARRRRWFSSSRSGSFSLHTHKFAGKIAATTDNVQPATAVVTGMGAGQISSTRLPRPGNHCGQHES